MVKARSAKIRGLRPSVEMTPETRAADLAPMLGALQVEGVTMRRRWPKL